MAFHAGIHDKALPFDKPAAHTIGSSGTRSCAKTHRIKTGRSGPDPVLNSKPGWFHPGKCKGMWCGRGDLNPHDLLGSADFHTTSAFAAPPAAGSWSGLYLHHPARVRCCPSSLYTFPEFFQAWLGIAFSGFPDFEQFYSASFPAGTQFP